MIAMAIVIVRYPVRFHNVRGFSCCSLLPHDLQTWGRVTHHTVQEHSIALFGQ